jgi:hypothetical protein
MVAALAVGSLDAAAVSHVSESTLHSIAGR